MVYGFITASIGFDMLDKLKLVLFFSKTKPVTYVSLKITNKNISEKSRFEKILKENKIFYNVSKAKGFDEISKIKRDKVVWKTKGIWFGYDLFHTKQQLIKFDKYKKLMKRGRFKQADKLGGSLYGYPSCCVNQFIKERDNKYLKKKYSYFEYYKRLQDIDKKFPFLFFNSCKKACKQAQKLNLKYKRAFKKHTPKLFEHYTAKKKYKIDLVVEGFSDIKENAKSIWPVKDGFDYNLLTKKAIRIYTKDKKFYMFDFLYKVFYPKGQVLKVIVTVQYDYPIVEVKKTRWKVIKGLHHERRFPLIGRKY